MDENPVLGHNKGGLRHESVCWDAVILTSTLTTSIEFGKYDTMDTMIIQ